MRSGRVASEARPADLLRDSWGRWGPTPALSVHAHCLPRPSRPQNPGPDFSGGPAAESLPANVGSVPGLGGFRIPPATEPARLEPVLHSKRSRCSEARATQLEKACLRQGRPSGANKHINKTEQNPDQCLTRPSKARHGLCPWLPSLAENGLKNHVPGIGSHIP